MKGHSNIKSKLKPEWLNDNKVNKVDWISMLRKVVVGAGGISAVVGGHHCLVHDPEHYHWRYYHLLKHGLDWALDRDSTRLWIIVGGGNLATLDLRSGKWTEFQHCTAYGSILYAEEDAVIVQCQNVFAIDVLRLQKDNLQRIKSIPIFRTKSHMENDSVPRVSSTFWSEGNQFIILEDLHPRQKLWKLSWDGRSEEILDFRASFFEFGFKFPFLVTLDPDPSSRPRLIYADLRKNPLALKHVDSSLRPEWKWWRSWMLDKIFVFDNDPIVALRLERSDEEIAALLRLGEQPEVLYERERRLYKSEASSSWWKLWKAYRLRQLGQFLLLGDEWVYDLVAREEKKMPWSALLRQAICGEVELQQRQNVTKVLSTLTSEDELSDPSTFKASLYPLSIHIAEANDRRIRLQDPLSSSSGHSSLGAKLVSSGFPKLHLLLKGDEQLKYLLPEPEPGWAIATFDEQERLWVCDSCGRYIAVVHPDREEACNLVLPTSSYSDSHSDEYADPSLYRKANFIAAYNNRVAIAYYHDLFIYRYEQKSLKELLQWKSNNDIIGIKPSIENEGWWIVTYVSDKRSCELIHLSLNKRAAVSEKVAEVAYRVRILGDWPNKLYLVYATEHDLSYALDPRNDWHKVSLWNILKQENHLTTPLVETTSLVEPVAMHENDDSVFFLLRATNEKVSFLVRLQADRPELISAFDLESWSTKISFAYWNNWLVLFSDSPIVFASAYAGRAEIEKLPQNKGMLFFDLRTNQFYARPQTPYAAITNALRRMLASKDTGFLSSLS